VDVAWGFMSMLVMGKVMEANIDAGKQNDLPNGGLGHFLFSTIKSQTTKDLAFGWLSRMDPDKKKPFIMFYNEYPSSIPFQIQKDSEQKKREKPMDPYRKQTPRGKRFVRRLPGR